MDVLSALERIKALKWVDENGEAREIEFLPGVTSASIARFEDSFGAPLPNNFRTLLEHCRGIEGAGIEVDFRSFEDDLWVEEILPHGLSFAHDGCGNYWVIDCRSTRESLSHIFYACHDAPVLIYQGTGLAKFLDALPAYDRGDRESAVWKIWDDSVWEIWIENPGLLSPPCFRFARSGVEGVRGGDWRALPHRRSSRRARWHGILLGKIRDGHALTSVWRKPNLRLRAAPRLKPKGLSIDFLSPKPEYS